MFVGVCERDSVRESVRVMGWDGMGWDGMCGVRHIDVYVHYTVHYIRTLYRTLYHKYVSSPYMHVHVLYDARPLLALLPIHLH